MGSLAVLNFAVPFVPGMIPIINSMMIVGIVSLPGMMTGQLLSGTRPAEAIKYQITIMFLIASATAIGTVISTIFALFSVAKQSAPAGNVASFTA